MKKTVRGMTLWLMAAVCVWVFIPFSRQEKPPAPADTEVSDVPDVDPFSLLVALTDNEVPAGFLVLTFGAQEASVIGVPQNARVAVGTAFYTLAQLYDPTSLQDVAHALEKQLKISIDNSVTLRYDFYSQLMQDHIGGVTLTLAQDVPIPFIGNALILPAGRQTLTPAQTVAYFRQSPDAVEASKRQAEVTAKLLDGWLTDDRQAQWDTLFADIANGTVTDWRADRYHVQRRTLLALSARQNPLPIAWQLPVGELVGEGALCRFEFADEMARPF